MLIFYLKFNRKKNICLRIYLFNKLFKKKNSLAFEKKNTFFKTVMNLGYQVEKIIYIEKKILFHKLTTIKFISS